MKYRYSRHVCNNCHIFLFRNLKKLLDEIVRKFEVDTVARTPFGKIPNIKYHAQNMNIQQLSWNRI